MAILRHLVWKYPVGGTKWKSDGIWYEITPLVVRNGYPQAFGTKIPRWWYEMNISRHLVRKYPVGGTKWKSDGIWYEITPLVVPNSCPMAFGTKIPRWWYEMYTASHSHSILCN